MEKLLMALALGDGCLKRNDKNTKGSLIIRHSTHQKDYIEWKYNLETSLWLEKPRLYKNINKGKRFYGYYINTSYDLKLAEIRNILYKNDKKYISREALQYLDELGLAIWYMDDGCIDRPINRNAMGILNTYCASPNAEEELIIQKYFKEKWDINCNINAGHGRYRIRFPHKEFCKFVEIIKPFIIPSLEYKIDTSMRLNTPTTQIILDKDIV